MTVIPHRRNKFSWLIALFLAALALRLVAVAYLPSPDIAVSESGRTAVNLLSGRGYTFDFYGYRQAQPLRSFMPPLYTAILAACMAGASGHAALALKLFQALLTSLSVPLIYAIGEAAFQPAVGVLAAVATAVYPVLLVVTTQPTITATNIFLLCLLLWTMFRVRESATGPRIALAGFVLGLNALNRPLILGFGLAIACWFFLIRDQLSRKWYVPVVGIAVVSALTITPWTVRNLVVQHSLIPVSTNGGFTFWNGNNPFTTGSGFDVYTERAERYVGHAPTSAQGTDSPIIVWEPYPLPHEIADRVESLDEVSLERALYAAGLRFIREHPRDWLRLEYAKLIGFWWFRANIGTYRNFYRSAWIRPYQLVYSLLFASFLAGMFFTRRRWRTLFLFYALFGFLTLAYVAYNVITRYRWEIEPLMFLFAAAAVVRVAEFWQS